jgi:hypothetical protein
LGRSLDKNVLGKQDPGKQGLGKKKKGLGKKAQGGSLLEALWKIATKDGAKIETTARGCVSASFVQPWRRFLFPPQRKVLGSATG